MRKTFCVWAIGMCVSVSIDAELMDAQSVAVELVLLECTLLSFQKVDTVHSNIMSTIFIY